MGSGDIGLKHHPRLIQLDKTWLTVVVVVDPFPVDPDPVEVDPVEVDPVSDHQTGGRYLQSQLTHWLFFH